MSLHLPVPYRRVLAAVALCTFAALLPSHRAFGQTSERRPPSLGEKTSAALGQLKALQDAGAWDRILKLLDEVPNIPPGSYDEAVLLDTKARVYGAMEQFSKALAPWERALELSDQHGYFTESQTHMIVGYLAQLFAQEAIARKDAKDQPQYFEKALHYFRRSLTLTKKPTPEAMLAHASLLFHKATSNPDQVETAALEEARAIADRGLLMAVRPRSEFYQMRLALLQQQNDLPGSSELIELLLQGKPENKDYWHALVNIYQQLALKRKDDDPVLAREYLVRAIISYERAQARGFLTSPKDNLTRASLYLNANQVTKGSEILHEGLKKGTIESEPNNWRLLGRFYYEANLPQQAIEALKEGAALFPQNSEMEVQLAHLCIQLEKTAEALHHAQAAVKKGNFETTKPFSMHYLIAYTAFDLGHLDEAQAALAASEAFPEDAAKDTQFSNLKTAIVDAVAERERRTQPTSPTSGPAPANAKKQGGS